MHQLGNLAIVCATRSDVLLQVQDGVVSLFVGTGPARQMLGCAWDDERKIKDYIYQLNFGKYKVQ